MKKPQANKTIFKIQTYKVGDSDSKNSSAVTSDKIVKLSANETPLGTPKSARLAFRANAKNLHLYPNSDCTPLRLAIAKKYKLNAAQIICGAGSDELLSLLAQAYLSNGDEAIYSQFGFLMYKINILANGAKPIVALEKNFCASVDNILAKLSNKTKMIFLANPNNPTGTYLPTSEIKRLHKNLPSDVILVLDCAYGEYMVAKNYSPCFDLVKKNNVVITRTFSKIYGLAAMRVGWAYLPKHIVEVLHRIRGPFNVNSAAIAAASAAIKDDAHIKLAVAHNEKWRQWLTVELQKLGLEIIPSYGNFITIIFGTKSAGIFGTKSAGIFGKPNSKKSADKADAFLRSRGFILRELKSYGFANALRMTIGTKYANITVVKLLKEFLHG